MKVKKVFGIALSLLLVLLLAMAGVVLFWLGPVVKAIGVHVGSKILGAPITIKTLVINPRQGTFHLSGLEIANHDGFNSTNAVSLAGLDIALDMGSVFSPTVVVSRVRIDSPHFTYEQNTATDNIAEFIRHIESLGSPDSAEETPSKSEDTAAFKTVVVQWLELHDLQFHLANTDDPALNVVLGLEKLSVSMTNGSVRLDNLYLTNPARLSPPNLFTLESIDVRIDAATLYTGPLQILDVRISKPYACLERTAETDTVAELMKIAAAFSSRAPAMSGHVAPAAPPESDSSADVPAPVVLRHLQIDDIQLRLRDAALAGGSEDPLLLAGIGSISARPIDGNLSIRDITVPSFPGFAASNLFLLAELDVVIDPASLHSKQIVIQDIRVNTPVLDIEQTETNGNFLQLQETLMAFVPPAPPAGTAAVARVEAPAEPVPLSEQPVVLESLSVSNLLVNLTLPVTTNEFSMGLDKMSLGKLNPMDYMGLGTNSFFSGKSVSASGRISLLSVQHLLARPLDGLVEISHLQVGNMSGFANQNLVEVQQFRLELDPATLQSETLLIKEILIEKPRVSYERQLATDNIQALQLNLEKAFSRRAEQIEAIHPAPAAVPDAEPEPAQKVVIGHLLVENGVVRAKLSALPTAPLPLPKIEIYDLGKESGGTTYRDVFSKLGTTFYDAIIGSVSSSTGIAGDAIKGVGESVFGAVDSVSGNLGDAMDKGLKSTEDAVGKTIDKIKGKTRRDKNSHPGRIF